MTTATLCCCEGRGRGCLRFPVSTRPPESQAERDEGLRFSRVASRKCVD